jgi:hypothetical protein
MEKEMRVKDFSSPEELAAFAAALEKFSSAPAIRKTEQFKNTEGGNPRAQAPDMTGN